MRIGGDLLFKVADFPEADILSQRYRRSIDPKLLDENPNAQYEKIMHEVADKVEQLTDLVAKQSQDLASKDRELDIREREVEIKEKVAGVDAHRKDYIAESDRVSKLGNSGPAIAPEQIQPILQQLLRGMMEAGEPGSSNGIDLQPKRPLPVEPTGGKEGAEAGGEPEAPEGAEPPVDGAKQAGDGLWYLPDPDRPGKYLRVDADAEAAPA